MPTLLQEWDLLEQEIVPLLNEAGRGSAPRVWSIGSAQDALALSWALQELAGSRNGTSAKVFLSGHRDEPDDLSFGSFDVRLIPEENRKSLHRENRRWAPAPDAAERVVLTEPREPVDLLTIRMHRSECRPIVAHALSNLRCGGRLLLISPEPSDLQAELSELDAGSRDNRLFSKQTSCAGSDREGGEDEAETLARRQFTQGLVRDHLPLARSLARRFAHHGEAAEDLNQVAYLALVRAAGRFDVTRDVRFATYATVSILGELKRHFRDKAWTLRVPRPVQERYLEIKRARDHLTQARGRVPTSAEVADHMSVSEAEVLEALRAGDNFWAVSLDARLSEDDPVREIPFIDEAFDKSIARVDLERSAAALDPRERLVVSRLYLDGRTQRQLAAEIGVSQMQVSRIVNRALTKLQGETPE